MPDIKQALKDYVATVNSGKYSGWDEVNTKFPELSGYDAQSLKDYVATVNSGKYNGWEEVNTKFPDLVSVEKKNQVQNEVVPKAPQKGFFEGVSENIEALKQSAPQNAEEVNLQSPSALDGATSLSTASDWGTTPKQKSSIASKAAPINKDVEIAKERDYQIATKKKEEEEFLSTPNQGPLGGLSDDLRELKEQYGYDKKLEIDPQYYKDVEAYAEEERNVEQSETEFYENNQFVQKPIIDDVSGGLSPQINQNIENKIQIDDAIQMPIREAEKHNEMVDIVDATKSYSESRKRVDIGGGMTDMRYDGTEILVKGREGKQKSVNDFVTKSFFVSDESYGRIDGASDYKEFIEGKIGKPVSQENLTEVLSYLRDKQIDRSGNKLKGDWVKSINGKPGSIEYKNNFDKQLYDIQKDYLTVEQEEVAINNRKIQALQRDYNDEVDEDVRREISLNIKKLQKSNTDKIKTKSLYDLEGNVIDKEDIAKKDQEGKVNITGFNKLVDKHYDAISKNLDKNDVSKLKNRLIDLNFELEYYRENILPYNRDNEKNTNWAYDKYGESHTTHKDEMDQEYYYTRMAEFLGANKALALNEDPAYLKRYSDNLLVDMLGNEASALTGGLINKDKAKEFVTSVGTGFGKEIFEFNSDEDVTQAANRFLDSEGFGNKDRSERAESTFAQKAGSTIGTSGAIMGKIMLEAAVTRKIGLGTALSSFSNMLKGVAKTKKYSKTLIKGINFLEEALPSGAYYKGAGSGFATGFAEGGVQHLFKNADKILEAGKYGKAFKFLGKTAVSTSAETLGEYAGEFVQELVDNGFDFGEAKEAAIGEDPWEKLALTLILTGPTSALANINNRDNMSEALRNAPQEVRNNPLIREAFESIEEFDGSTVTPETIAKAKEDGNKSTIDALKGEKFDKEAETEEVISEEAEGEQEVTGEGEEKVLEGDPPTQTENRVITGYTQDPKTGKKVPVYADVKQGADYNETSNKKTPSLEVVEDGLESSYTNKEGKFYSKEEVVKAAEEGNTELLKSLEIKNPKPEVKQVLIDNGYMEAENKAEVEQQQTIEAKTEPVTAEEHLAESDAWANEISNPTDKSKGMNVTDIDEKSAESYRKYSDAKRKELENLALEEDVEPQESIDYRNEVEARRLEQDQADLDAFTGADRNEKIGDRLLEEESTDLDQIAEAHSNLSDEETQMPQWQKKLLNFGGRSQRTETIEVDGVKKRKSFSTTDMSKKISQSSYEEVSGLKRKDWPSKMMGSHWFTAKGGQAISDVAEEVGASVDEVARFIEENPAGTITQNPTKKELAKRYKEVSGKSIDTHGKDSKVKKRFKDQNDIEVKKAKEFKDSISAITARMRAGKIKFDPNELNDVTRVLPATAYNYAIEAAAITLDATASITQAIIDGVKAIKDTEYYKNLSEDKQAKMEAVIKRDVIANAKAGMEEHLAKMKNIEKKTVKETLKEKVNKEINKKETPKSDKEEVVADQELKTVADRFMESAEGSELTKDEKTQIRQSSKKKRINFKDTIADADADIESIGIDRIAEGINDLEGGYRSVIESRYINHLGNKIREAKSNGKTILVNDLRKKRSDFVSDMAARKESTGQENAILRELYKDNPSFAAAKTVSDAIRYAEEVMSKAGKTSQEIKAEADSLKGTIDEIIEEKFEEIINHPIIKEYISGKKVESKIKPKKKVSVQQKSRSTELIKQGLDKIRKAGKGQLSSGLPLNDLLEGLGDVVVGLFQLGYDATGIKDFLKGEMGDSYEANDIDTKIDKEYKKAKTSKAKTNLESQLKRENTPRKKPTKKKDMSNLSMKERITKTVMEKAGLNPDEINDLPDDVKEVLDELIGVKLKKAFKDKLTPKTKNGDPKGMSGKKNKALEEQIEMAYEGGLNDQEIQDLFFEKYGVIDMSSPEMLEKLEALAEKVESAKNSSLADRARRDFATYIAEITNKYKWNPIQGPLSMFYMNILSGPVTHLKNFSYNVPAIMTSTLREFMFGRGKLSNLMHGRFFNKSNIKQAIRIQKGARSEGDARANTYIEGRINKNKGNIYGAYLSLLNNLSSRALISADALFTRPFAQMATEGIVRKKIKDEASEMEFDSKLSKSNWIEAETARRMGFTKDNIQSAEGEAMSNVIDYFGEEMFAPEFIREFNAANELGKQAVIKKYGKTMFGSDVSSKMKNSVAQEVMYSTDAIIREKHSDIDFMDTLKDDWTGASVEELGKAYGRDVALQGEAIGLAGMLGDMLHYFNRSVPVLQKQITFVTVASKIMEKVMRGLPVVGLLGDIGRYKTGNKSSLGYLIDKYGLAGGATARYFASPDRKISKEQATRNLQNQIVIQSVHVGLAILSSSLMDDDEGNPLMITTGAQTGNYFKNMSIEKGGGLRPYTVYFRTGKKDENGNIIYTESVNYKNSPLGYIFGFWGARNDQTSFKGKKTGQVDERGELSLFGASLASSLTMIQDKSMMKGMDELLKTLSVFDKYGNNKLEQGGGTEKFLNGLTKFSNTMVVPNFIKQSGKYMKSPIADLTGAELKQMRATKVWHNLIKGIPVLEDMFLDTAYGSFGEDLENPNYDLVARPDQFFVEKKAVKDENSKYYELYTDNNMTPGYFSGKPNYINPEGYYEEILDGKGETSKRTVSLSKYDRHQFNLIMSQERKKMVDAFLEEKEDFKDDKFFMDNMYNNPAMVKKRLKSIETNSKKAATRIFFAEYYDHEFKVSQTESGMTIDFKKEGIEIE